jgi:DNA polymerase-3 subunit gamma/tau
MENFIVSARKYRPASFDMVIGQDSITNTLKSAIRNNHLAQAYLFCGPRGVGKTTCARIFAKTINCINLGQDAEACDECESCRSFNTLRSFNIHELDAASNNKVEDIRSLNDQVRIPPQIGKYSIYIIDEVHMLSASAFNAFLKTLEEPPAHAIFILATTEKHKIIPTILSRCQIFDFNRIKIEDIVKRLSFVATKEGITAAEEALHVIGQKADGAMRDALSIFDQIVSLSGKSMTYKDVIENLNVLDYEYYFSVVDGALKGDLSSVLITFNEILDKGFDGHNFISGLNSHFRNLLVSKDESTLRLLEVTPAIKKRFLQQTGKCSVDFIFRALDAGLNCDLNYKNSKNQRLHVELSLIKLCRLMDEYGDPAEKKKPVLKQKTEDDVENSVSSESEISKHEKKIPEKSEEKPVAPASKQEPVVSKTAKSFSIKDLISDGDTISDSTSVTGKADPTEKIIPNEQKVEFSREAFDIAWQEFLDHIKGEGTRIVSMFKSITPEVENDKNIKIHLSNTDQKETFVLNYKHKLIAFLENKFIISEIDIESIVDEAPATDILYTDEQKFNFLFNKYPVLKEMKRTFNLDLN